MWSFSGIGARPISDIVNRRRGSGNCLPSENSRKERELDAYRRRVSEEGGLGEHGASQGNAERTCVQKEEDAASFDDIGVKVCSVHR